jgi:hypothetical protein
LLPTEWLQSRAGGLRAVGDQEFHEVNGGYLEPSHPIIGINSFVRHHFI